MTMFRAKNLLITGGAGFIGSNFIEYLLDKYQTVNIYNLDILTYAGNLKNTQRFEKNPRYKFIKGNICDKTLLNKIFKNNKIDGVINFAAETHVDNSITNSDIFIKTNINGVHNLLSVSRDFWMKDPFNYKKKYINSRFHQVSTDEVYGSIKSGSFDESCNYKPNSPYSASKASADMLVRSFNKTFGLNTTISVSSNNFGPNQHHEKLIPKILKCIKENIPIPIYGDGRNIRDWLYVGDNCRAIEIIYVHAENGSIYNVGGEFEMSNIEIIKLIHKFLGISSPNIEFINDRHGHDFRYSLNNKKIKKELNFKIDKPSVIKLEEYIKQIKK